MKKFIFIFAIVLTVTIGAFAQFGFLQKLQGNSNASDNQGSKVSSIKNMFSDAGKVLKGVGGKKPDLTHYSKGVGQITTTLFEKGFDPQTEFDADKGGFKLAATVGYAPNGLEQCLQTLQQHESPNMTIFPTHPPLDKRIEKLESYQAGGL
jgi:hypothetical protein